MLTLHLFRLFAHILLCWNMAVWKSAILMFTNVNVNSIIMAVWKSAILMFTNVNVNSII